MRPINLIPLEERRGEQAPLRSGPLAYVLIGALVALLAGVVALVLTGNQISEREAEVATLVREDAAASAKAKRLAPYAQFQTLSEQRVETVSRLADSRFDWERVMRELSLILPADAWLVGLIASAGGEGESSSSGSNLSGAALGPTLELSGCATGQEAVAGFVTALKDIEGVTRVGVASSELGEGAGGGGSGGDDCRTRDFIAAFEIVVAFDAAPLPLASGSEETVPVAPAPPAEGGEGEATPTSEGTEG